MFLFQKDHKYFAVFSQKVERGLNRYSQEVIRGEDQNPQPGDTEESQLNMGGYCKVEESHRALD